MFQQGLSGLDGASQSLDVIGNNIANASTVGFKSSTAEFADVYANSLNSVGGNTAGIGVSVAAIAQNFTQGSIQTSTNPLDISINGGGFFRTTLNGQIQFSRNGQFTVSPTNQLINAQGAQITGYLANKSGQILQGSPIPIVIDKSDLTPVQTTKANYSANLNSTEPNPTVTPFDANNPLTYNHPYVQPVYDSLGNQHTMSVYYVKTAASTWDVYASVDGTEIAAQTALQSMQQDPNVSGPRATYQADLTANPPVGQAQLDSDAQAYSAAAGASLTALATTAGASQPQLDALAKAYDVAGGTDAGSIPGATPDTIDAALAAALQVPPAKVGTLVFDKNGALSNAGMALLTPPVTLPISIAIPIFPDAGSQEPLTIATNFTGTTQYGSTYSEKDASQDGSSSGSLKGYQVGADGVILGNYSNGLSRPLAQIAMANFSDVNGLTPLGNNAWAESAKSGVPQVGAPGSGSFGSLRSNSVEESNVDLTTELVNMITAQRVYQANAQTIKTEDSILQTVVNLR
ncbi:flagellar hook protein FlgE [Rugamonas sp.]|uniref:flagellar hook protein FlgE n=1 Tax=Rugamonas sp. TaxID=1926287 RepID=UPI0025CFA140|nr:flagellar hook protein FlgE [Rugamonas sp.]